MQSPLLRLHLEVNVGTVVSKFPHLVLNSVIVTVETAQSLMILDLGVK